MAEVTITFSGRPGSGKTMLSDLFYKLLSRADLSVARDGDTIRVNASYSELFQLTRLARYP